MEILNKSDEELMVLYQNGNEMAFQALYDRHSSKILGFIKSKIFREEKAHEVFQEVYIKIHRSKHLYNKSLPLLPWIFTITRNAILDEVRKHKDNEISVETESLDKLVPATEVSTNDLELNPLLQRLPPQQKMAVEMRYYDEKTFEEIAETLNTSPVNIRKLVSRGVQRIKELIKEGGN